jgi:gephyrin
MNQPYPMIPVPQAQETVLAHAQPLAPVTVPLSGAQGLILAEDVTAAAPLPPFPAAVKDGYAVVAADGPGIYPVAGQVTAGKIAGFQLRPGEVAYITTGAPMPPGADAVVMVEDTQPQPADARGVRHVQIGRRVQTGADVRPVGVDVAAGETVLPHGSLLGAAEIGLLATVGAREAAVHPRPRVAIMSTGDELVEPGAPLEAGQIYDSNRATLAAAIHAMGGVPVDLGIAHDNEAELRARLAQGLAQADILLTSGGVSMGDLDLIKPLLEQIGVVHFGRLRMKPGKPCSFATAAVDGQTRLIFGLPGNPVSSLVTFYLLVVPAIRRMAGRPDPTLRRIQVTLDQALPLDADRPEYHRATAVWQPALNDGAGGYLAHSTGSQASSRLLSMRTANVLLALPQGEGTLARGAKVDALVIGELD